MRLHRFYIDIKIDNPKVLISEDRLVHQWRNVFRYNVGSEVILFDGSGLEYDAVIEKINNREVEVGILSKRQGLVPNKKIYLYQSIIKKDKMEWVIEKATELGVAMIKPIISERSEKKGFNIERARKIAVEASEQCGRADVPVVESVGTLEDAVEYCKNNQNKIIVFDCFASSPTIKVKGEDLTAIFIGPEGGWSENEMIFFREKGAQILSLGALTLRAETAAIVALAISKPLD